MTNNPSDGPTLGDDGSPDSNRGSEPPGSGSGTTPTGDLQIVVEPNGNKGQEVVDAINAAQKSVYMTMYELDDKDVINALIARQAAGVDVEVLMDGSSTTKSNNAGAYASLTGANPAVAVKYTVPEDAGPFALTHQKTVIIDDTTAWIMTMNLETSSPSDDREYLAMDTAPADVAEATAIFKSDYTNPTGTPITAEGNLVVSPSLQGGNSEATLAALVNSATQTLDIEVEEMTSGNDVVAAIGSAAKRGVAVRMVLGNSGTSDTTDINAFKTAGVMLVQTGPTSNDGTTANPYIASKAIIVDCNGTTTGCKTGYVGSENFSTQSLLYNRELGVVFTDASQLALVKAAIDTDFAAGTAL